MKKLLNKLFKRKFKSYLLNDSYKIVEAFTFQGKKYYCFDDSFKVPTGRGMSALDIYEELRMNANREYLELHCRAVDKILTDPKKINIGALALIHNNLKERLEMVKMPDYVFKMASVMYFDDSESPYVYDWTYSQKKIAEWKKDPEALTFFLNGPLKGMMPFIDSSNSNAQVSFSVAEKVNDLHLSDLSNILSKQA